MKYKCVIFDCDGVLVDSELISVKVLVQMAKSVGADFKLSQAINMFSGMSLKNVFDTIELKANKKLPESFEKDFRNNTFKAFKNELKPIDGVFELLSRLDVPYCVASSGPFNKIELNLTITKLIDFFEGRIFSSYDIQSWKPDPGIFLHAANEMGFSPHECVVIEDSQDGIKAAKLGGFDVYGVANENNLDLLKLQDIPIIYDMNSLDSILS